MTHYRQSLASLHQNQLMKLSQAMADDWSAFIRTVEEPWGHCQHSICSENQGRCTLSSLLVTPEGANPALDGKQNWGNL